MPYEITRSGGQFVVRKKDGSHVFGRHKSKGEAEAQLRALYANTKGFPVREADEDDDKLIYIGDFVKALDGAAKVGGYLVRFGDPGHADLQGDYFTKDTDFGLDTTSRVRMLFHHGLDPALSNDPIGTLALKADDVGVWAEGVISRADDYGRKILEMVKAGKLRWSSGTAPHCLKRTPIKGGANRIDRWPLVEGSLTPTPVEPRTMAMSLKAFADEIKGLHLGEYAEHRAAMAALDSLHGALMGRLHGHLMDVRSTKARKLAACKACLKEHHGVVMRAVKAMLPDDDHDVEPDYDRDDSPAMKSRRDWLSANAPH